MPPSPEQRLSTLEAAILGLLGEGPKSGYAVRQVFRSTALASYSDSPGSIYPALARLVRRRVVRSTRQAKGHGRVFDLTAAGRRTLEAWLAEPVTASDAMRPDGTLELKLAFLTTSNPGRLRSFVREWAAASAEAASLLSRQLRQARAGLPESGALALELGTRMLQARARTLRGILKRIESRPIYSRPRRAGNP